MKDIRATQRLGFSYGTNTYPVDVLDVHKKDQRWTRSLTGRRPKLLIICKHAMTRKN